jgi:3-hydroxybutyrate dehydrogenase
MQSMRPGYAVWAFHLAARAADAEPMIPIAALRPDAHVLPANRPLEGRVAVVTGPAGEDGLGIAAALAGQGARLMLNGYGRAAAVERARARLSREHEVEVVCCAADLADTAAVAGMLGFARDVLGPIDILVNTPGVARLAPVAAYPAAQWDAILNANLSAAFHAIRAVLPEMTAQGWGRIVNIAAADDSSPFRAAHAAARHGLVGLTRSVALEADGTGVTCNALRPGPALAGEVAFLCSEQGGAITGAAPAADG